MNKRLEELALECNAWNQVYDDKRFMVDGNFDVERFAELIVAECLGIVDDAERGGSNEIWDNAVKFIRRDLQEHFGVK